MEEKEAVIASPAPFSMERKVVAGNKRYFISLAKKTSRPGIFEMLGSYGLKKDDAELFGDDRYRRLMNILIYRSQL